MGFSSDKDVPAAAPATEIPANPRIAIVGSGSIGGYFGACLAEQGNDVHFLMRSDLEAVRQRGMQIRRRHLPNFELKTVNAYGSSGEIGPCDVVLIALKTTQNDALLKLLPPLLKPSTTLVTLQNGLGNTEFLDEHFGAGRAVGGLVYIGINRVDHGVIENYNPEGGYVTLGEANGPSTQRVRQLAEMIDRAGIRGKVTEDLQETLWRKLVWNVPFNGLSIAAGGITTDKILASTELTHLAQALMRDVQAGARALGREIPDSFIDGQIKYTTGLGAYKPSSLIDYLAKRPVEVEAIWGETLRRGSAAGAKMPYLDSLYCLLKEVSKVKD